MERLFDLLKLHCRKKYMFGDNDEIEIDCDSVCFHLYFRGRRLFPLRYETIICKEFGFIKRLVENDKIELEAGPLYGCQLIMHNRQPYTLYETLLMLLAISDTPIEDLISYLR